MKKLAILLLALCMVSTSAEAQFWKKLKQKKDAAIDNLSEKTTKDMNLSLDSLGTPDLAGMGFTMGAERVDPAELPSSYDFNWQYTLTMKSDKKDIDMTYLLSENAPYVGIIMPKMDGMTMVMDNEKGHMVMFMNSGGTKMLSASKLNLDAAAEGAEVDNPYEGVEYKEIPPKEILGYTCNGYQATTDEYDLTFYVTDEAGVSFSNVFANQQEKPKDFNPEWLEKANGLMMEMTMVDKKNPKKNVTMTCTSIDKKDFSIQKSDYQAY